MQVHVLLLSVRGGGMLSGVFLCGCEGPCCVICFHVGARDHAVRFVSMWVQGAMLCDLFLCGCKGPCCVICFYVGARGHAV